MKIKFLSYESWKSEILGYVHSNNHKFQYRETEILPFKFIAQLTEENLVQLEFL